MPSQVSSESADFYTVRQRGDYVLDFLGGDDTLTVDGGTTTTATMDDGNDYVRLLSGMATVDGGAGNDRFDILASGVTASGGLDNDLFVLRGGSGQTINGNDGNDRVNLAANVSNLTADLGAGDDTFVGYGYMLTGSIHGGAGADTFVDIDASSSLSIYGGTGDDVYRAWGANSANFVELPGEGADTVELARGLSYVLPDNIERIIVGSYQGNSGVAATITGNSLANGITGSGNAEMIFGLAGNDRLLGKGGDDIIHGGNDNDLVDGGLGNDTLYGDDGSDSLVGREGDDTMVGGTGNDTYYVDSLGDVVIENANQGTDAIRTTVTLTLADNVENGVVASAEGLTLYGNTLDNRLYGGAGDDCIFASDGDDAVRGGDGNDYLGGEVGNDTIIGGAGNDYLFGDEGNDTVKGGDGDDYLQGYTGNDALDGGNGSDLLAGGEGADRLIGGEGSDCFFYYDQTDSTAAAPDRIADFLSLDGEGNGDDQIDLSLIDANTNLSGDQAFAGIGSAAAANSLWFTVQASSGPAQDWTFYGDTDGNPATVEFELHVHSIAGAVWIDDVTL